MSAYYPLSYRTSGNTLNSYATTTNYIYTYSWDDAVSARLATPPTPKPDTPEDWLRGRVKEICDLVKLDA